ncbi:unnamed protein product [Porites evermanni]|uniref:MYND-type domain-containing protein n=1 Tax=Porites evermanni TaxID=104178 RepID=A0ABN8LDW7_9CNID|nr:unnamed protein product [Porites evermanni]
MSRCFNCEKNCETKRCTGCHQAFYCSKTCQKNHWGKHKENCIRADSSIHELFKLITKDVGNLELGDTMYVFNSIGVSKKMIVKA